MRINKLLSNYGYCSRKQANEIIRDNRIMINGEIAKEGQWVEEYDEIKLDGKVLLKKERVYIALNKPVGITCTADENKEGNIIDFMNYKDYIFPVGRLDKDSQGLIIMTNDGDLANKILESENEHEKEYIVRLDREFDDEFLEGMSKPIDIGVGITKESKLSRIDKDTFKIIITQGLNRQIRRMSKSLGYEVVFLQRIRIINVELGSLGIGGWRNLTEDELDYLKNA